ncbi:M13 family metallopeptidase [Pseudomaricurvus sp.]|uniref:M13 family metallopeptidase n=1 Tax=Pseudomaricurvus sp. TaxID=2004510 RepID=UPI003F6D9B56
MGIPVAGMATEDAADKADKPMLGEWGVETQNLSSSVSPGDDFYRYVNQGWLDTVEIPQGFPRIDSFVDVYLRSEEQIEAIITHVDKAEVGGEQIQALYQSYMDKERIEKLGLTPIRGDLRKMLKITRHSEIARWMAKPMQQSAIGVGVQLDEKNPEQYALRIWQGGLGLPDRAYYLDGSKLYADIRADYTDYIKATFTRAGLDWVDQRAAEIVEFETQLAKVHWPAEEVRDRIRNYQPMSMTELTDYAPGFDWTAFMDEMQLGKEQRLIVSTNTAIQETARLIAETPVDALKSYLLFHYIDNHASLLPEEYAEAQFAFYSTRLNGIAEQRTREQRAQKFVNNSLGELVGRIYAERYFPDSDKAILKQYIGYIREAFRQRINQSPWMDKATQAEAFQKLDAFVAKIGYPDKWRDFSSIVIRPTDLIGNIQRIQKWSWADDLAKLHEPRRTWEWGMNPQDINAYYASSRNEIVFPAAIFQPPFFDANADPAVNFAAIGAVIGHEMGHGFDDQGSLSDGSGRLRDWWTPTSREQFEQRTAELVKQYNGYEPLEGLHVNGQLTLGENIGDLGGVSVAYEAYRRFVKEKFDGRAPVIDGYSGDQRFFMSWAQMWRSKQTEGLMRKLVLTNPHSPNQYRVNGVLRNVDAWYDAFSVNKGDALYLPPQQRVHIW